MLHGYAIVKRSPEVGPDHQIQFSVKLWPSLLVGSYLFVEDAVFFFFFVPLKKIVTLLTYNRLLISARPNQEETGLDL